MSTVLLTEPEEKIAFSGIIAAEEEEEEEGFFFLATKIHSEIGKKGEIMGGGEPTERKLEKNIPRRERE